MLLRPRLLLLSILLFLALPWPSIAEGVEGDEDGDEGELEVYEEYQIDGPGEVVVTCISCSLHHRPTTCAQIGRDLLTYHRSHKCTLLYHTPIPFPPRHTREQWITI